MGEKKFLSNYPLLRTTLVVVPPIHRHVVEPHAATLVVNAVTKPVAAVKPATPAAMTLREAVCSILLSE
jgi:hypothetical protein